MTVAKGITSGSAGAEPSGDWAELDHAFGNPAVPEGLRRSAPTLHQAARDFWAMALGLGPLSPRMKELVLVALHGTVTALDSEAVHRHVRRALAAGATELDVIDVMVTIVSLANHALYFSVPVLIRELNAAGRPEGQLPPLDAEGQAIKEAFVRERGFWNEQRDVIARMMPEYFAELSKVSTESWKNGSLTRKERELVCIAIDCTVTHMFEPGLAIHIRNALQAGATADEILEVFKLSAVLGLEGYVLSANALFGGAQAR